MPSLCSSSLAHTHTYRGEAAHGKYREHLQFYYIYTRIRSSPSSSSSRFSQIGGAAKRRLLLLYLKMNACGGEPSFTIIFTRGKYILKKAYMLACAIPNIFPPWLFRNEKILPRLNFLDHNDLKNVRKPKHTKFYEIVTETPSRINHAAFVLNLL